MKKFFGFLILLSILSCETDGYTSSEEVLTEEQFIAVYQDVLVLENYYQTKYGLPSAYKKELEKSCKEVFKKHHFTKEQFDKSFDFYAHNPEKMIKINEQVIANLNKKKI